MALIALGVAKSPSRDRAFFRLMENMMKPNPVIEQHKKEREEHLDMLRRYSSYRNPYDYVVGCIAKLDRQWGDMSQGEIPALQGRKTAFEELRKQWEGLCPDLKIAGATRPTASGGEHTNRPV